MNIEYLNNVIFKHWMKYRNSMGKYWIVDSQIVKIIPGRRCCFRLYWLTLFGEGRDHPLLFDNTKHAPTGKYVASACPKFPLICTQKPTLVSIDDKLRPASQIHQFTRLCLWMLVKICQTRKRPFKYLTIYLTKKNFRCIFEDDYY